MPGTPTPFYGFPIPAYNDPADGPDAIGDLAQSIEDTLKNGYTMPDGSLNLGKATSATGQIVNFIKLDGVDVYEGAAYIGAGGVLVLRLYKNSAEVNRFRVYADGSVQVGATGGTVRPVPFATYAYLATITLASQGAAAVTVTFPVGRFTVAPVVTATTTVQAYYAYTGIPTASSVNVGVCHRDGTTASIPVGAYVFCTQMTPTSATG